MQDARRFWVRVVWASDSALASVLRLLLRPFSWTYGIAVMFRNWLFRVGIRSRYRLPVPVICVGNITVGGAGKTPMAEWLAVWLAQAGRKPAVLSRGYRARRPGEGNDETRMLGEAVPGLIQVVDPDRVRGGRKAVEELGADCLVMDDGFQHIRLCRDLDIALVDALDPFGGDALLPAGGLREPKSALRRADVVVVTRCDLISKDELAALRGGIQRLAPNALVVTARYEPVGLTSVDGQGGYGGEWLKDKRVFAFCGVGNPRGFFKTLGLLEPASLAGVALDDHALYSPGRLARLARAAREADAEVVVVTAKDAVKIRRGAWPGSVPVMALRIRMEIVDGKDALIRCLGRALGKE